MHEREAHAGRHRMAAKTADEPRTTCVDFGESYTLGKEMLRQGLNAVQTLPNGYDAASYFLEAADGEASTSPKVDLFMYQLSSNPL